MKKILLSSIICSILFANTAIANNDKMFEDTNSKEWSSTPANVKDALKNIKVLSGSSAKDMMSVNWLKEMKRSPSTYGLNTSDVQWVDGMLNATNNKANWNPKTKVTIQKSDETKKSAPVAIAKNEPIKKDVNKVENVAKTSKTEKIDIPTRLTMQPLNVDKKQEDKKIDIKKDAIVKKEDPKKAISVPLPKAPTNYASNKNQDLTPSRDIDKVENKKNENEKSLTTKDKSMVKISDALIAIDKKNQESKTEEIQKMSGTINEIIKFESINNENIVNNNRTIEKLNYLIDLDNEKLKSDTIIKSLSDISEKIEKTDNELLEIVEKIELGKENKKIEDQLTSINTEKVDLNLIESGIKVIDEEIKNQENAIKKEKEIRDLEVIEVGVRALNKSLDLHYIATEKERERNKAQEKTKKIEMVKKENKVENIEKKSNGWKLRSLLTLSLLALLSFGLFFVITKRK